MLFVAIFGPSVTTRDRRSRPRHRPGLRADDPWPGAFRPRLRLRGGGACAGPQPLRLDAAPPRLPQRDAPAGCRHHARRRPVDRLGVRAGIPRARRRPARRRSGARCWTPAACYITRAWWLEVMPGLAIVAIRLGRRPRSADSLHKNASKEQPSWTATTSNTGLQQLPIKQDLLSVEEPERVGFAVEQGPERRTSTIVVKDVSLLAGSRRVPGDRRRVRLGQELSRPARWSGLPGGTVARAGRHGLELGWRDQVAALADRRVASGCAARTSASSCRMRWCPSIPLRPVGKEIEEALRLHGWGNNRRPGSQGESSCWPAWAYLSPQMRAGQRPDELSGGLRQRALIASAIAMDPKIDDRRRADHGAGRDRAGADP